MTNHKLTVALLAGMVVLLFALTATPCLAQIDHNIQVLNPKAESHVEGLTGQATGSSLSGIVLYRRFCVGCHGAAGDGNGENAPWIDPKPRDFILAAFKCRSTPTGTLPTDQDLYNAITRGFVTSNMPSWDPLTPQQRADLVAVVKSFSPRWQNEKPGTPIVIPAETPINIESILRRPRDLPEERVLEVPWPGGARRRSVRFHFDGQQGQSNPAV